MIRINLIPYREEQQKAKARRQIVLLAASLLLVIVAAGLFHAHMTMTISLLEKDVQASRAELERLRAITGDLERYRQDQALVETKLQIIEELEKNRDEGYRLLTELARIVPEGQLWLTRLSKQGATLRLEGMARNNAAVALFMERMEDSPMIGSVDLGFSRRVAHASTELKSFQISLNLKQGASWQ